MYSLNRHIFQVIYSIFAAWCYASAAYVVMWCLCVYLYVCVSITFVHFVKTNKRIFKIFHYRVAKPFGIFRPKGTIQIYYYYYYSFVGYDPLLFFMFCSFVVCVSTRSLVDHGHRPTSWEWHTAGSIAVVLIAGEDDEMFMTRSLNVTPKTTEQCI